MTPSLQSLLHESMFDKPEFQSLHELMNYREPHVTTIGNQLIDIISEERSISEKAYEALDRLKDEIDGVYQRNPDIKATIAEFQQQGKRNRYCAEYIYDRYWKK